LWCERTASALIIGLLMIGVQPQVGSAAETQNAPPKDINSSDPSVQLKDGWYSLESFKNETFRWVNNDAVFAIKDAHVYTAGLSIELEPGPGMGSRPLVLRVLDSTGRQVHAAQVNGRQSLKLYLPKSARAPGLFRLHVNGGGNKTPSDPRVLNFRVFRLLSASYTPRPADIAFGAITLGDGWLPYESYKGESFRWVNNDAWFTVLSSNSDLKIVAEVEPGPSADSKPIVLRVLDSRGRQVQAIEINGRQNIELILPSAKSSEASYRFHVDGHFKPAPGDPRVLSFRVFRIAALR
jgi:hypothetical protein